MSCNLHVFQKVGVVYSHSRIDFQKVVYEHFATGIGYGLQAIV